MPCLISEDRNAHHTRRRSGQPTRSSTAVRWKKSHLGRPTTRALLAWNRRAVISAIWVVIGRLTGETRTSNPGRHRTHRGEGCIYKARVNDYSRGSTRQRLLVPRPTFDLGGLFNRTEGCLMRSGSHSRKVAVIRYVSEHIEDTSSMRRPSPRTNPRLIRKAQWG